MDATVPCPHGVDVFTCRECLGSPDDCRHGLDPRTCSACLGKPPLGQEPEVAERVFAAKFPGDCPGCNLPIHVGERIAGTSRGRYLHEGCVDA